ncbi:MAG: 1-(5-phosphoribosyl)-5-[(5-phosphoribosylamino)methylideneamino]imidazole-4-carboxamide isomerase [Alphaproteobacteria bacterium]|nr:1-(5-phosphoribosyl)-5-[(5-phosphoribosylamino)methylideneamino]imidazole-4-carboxamide isomerase [Alphaproteobacteria bacterium]
MIYPSIDLIDGKCVRLYKGAFAQKTIYETTPVNIAKSYKADGAEWIHIVDLDGAKNPENRQVNLIKNIINASGLKIQTGGGIRNFDDVQTLIDAGASRVVIGSMAVKNPDLIKDIISKFGANYICLAADVTKQNNIYKISISGWQESSTIHINDFLTDYQNAGIKHILCTDISKDGTMQGCNFELYQDLIQKFPDLSIQASGGVSTLQDLKTLTTDGVIIGKALYEGAFTLCEALEAVTC